MRQSLVVCVLLLVAAPVAAQVCAGGTSFRDSPVHFGVAPTFNSDGLGFGASVAVGGNTVFGGAGVDIQRVSDLDSTATAINLIVGSEHPVDSMSRVFVCPVGGVSFLSGPDIGIIDVSGWGVEGGGRVGIVARRTSIVRIVPTFGALVIHQRVTLAALGDELSASDTYAAAIFGVGVAFWRVFITPRVIVPIGLAGSNASFQTTVGFAF